MGEKLTKQFARLNIKHFMKKSLEKISVYMFQYDFYRCSKITTYIL